MELTVERVLKQMEFPGFAMVNEIILASLEYPLSVSNKKLHSQRTPLQKQESQEFSLSVFSCICLLVGMRLRENAGGN